MNNIEFGNIAIATIIVGIFDLLIILLIRTETILKIVERIKGVIQVDFKSRAKRSDDELRISKRHDLVAKERVRNSFITFKLWNCKWTWNWSDSFEPINVKGYCLGDINLQMDEPIYFKCNHPVTIDLLYRGGGQELLFIRCSQDGEPPHRTIRAEFNVWANLIDHDEQAEFQSMISKKILSERDLRIAKEIKKLRLQFWR